MKSPQEIQLDIEKRVTEAREKKKRANVKKLIELQKISRVMTHNEVALERAKLASQLKHLESIFPSFLDNFTLFRFKDEEVHKRKVRKVFNKEFEIPKIKTRIRDLDYLLNIK